MYRILVVEDNTEFYENELLRFFAAILPMDKLEIVRAESLEKALVLIGEQWDAILVDYFLGPPALRPEGVIGEGRVKQGADLVEIRRDLEPDPASEARIIGISSFQVGNASLVKAGANASHSKSSLEDIAREVGRGLEAHG